MNRLYKTWCDVDAFTALGRVENDLDLLKHAVVATNAGFRMQGREAGEEDRMRAVQWVIHVMVSAAMLRRVMDGRAAIVDFDGDNPQFTKMPGESAPPNNGQERV